MARYKFPKGLEGTEDLPRTRQLLRNSFLTPKGDIFPRPGIDTIAIVGGNARGGFEWNGFLYQVYSEELRKFTDVDTGAFTVISTNILTSEPIFTAAGENEIAIIVKGGQSFTLDKFDVLTETSGNANFVPFISVTYINGRAIYVPATGDKVVFSDVGELDVIQALSFFTAEQRPDNNNIAFTLQDLLYIGGEQSIERFRDTGTTIGKPNPFVRVGGAIDVGFIGGLVEYDNSFLFVGRKTGQSPGMFAVDNRTGIKISNEAIDLILTDYTNDELTETLGGRINVRNAYDIVTFALRRDSFMFFNGGWPLLDTVIEEVSRPWIGGFITEFDNRYYSAFDDKLGRFTTVKTDYGNRITRTLETTISEDDADFIKAQSLEFGISQGFNTNQTVDGETDGEFAASVSLQTSEGGQVFGPKIYRSLGGKGHYANKLSWNDPGGLGTYEGFMGIRLETTEDVIFTGDYLIVKAKG